MIWIVVLTIVGIISLIQTLDNYYKNNPKKESSSTSNSTTTYNKPNYAVVTQKEINKNSNKNSETVIKQFFDYCNNQKVKEAYSLLSEECKQELYQTEEAFKQKYYDKIFTESKMYNSILWISNENKNTYRLEIIGDILATGKKETMPIEEYYTTIYSDGKYKLNINGFIEKEELNILNKQKNITIELLNRNIYIDHETYEIKVKNKTMNNIVFNTKETTDSMFIQDKNEVKYYAFLNEISETEFIIPPGHVRTYNIKFNKGYKGKSVLEKIVFGNIKQEYEVENKTIEIKFN
jgi:hypothetical protein